MPQLRSYRPLCILLFVEEICVIFLNSLDEITDILVKRIVRQAVVLHSTAQAYTVKLLGTIKAQEAVILAVIEIMLASEERELITIRSAVIRTERCAVAAFVAHAVYMDDLCHSLARHTNRDIRTVRTYLDAGLADRSALEAAIAFHAAADSILDHAMARKCVSVIAICIKAFIRTVFATGNNGCTLRCIGNRLDNG